MNQKIFSLILISSLFQFISCTDEVVTFNPINEPLPQATKTGANTFGFLLNGKTWLPYSDDKSKKTINVLMRKDSSFQFFINLASDNIKRDETLEIFLQCNKPGPCSNLTFLFIDSRKSLGCKVFSPNKNLSLEITHLDFAQQIISGNFKVDGEINGCGDDKITITNGVFDCKFTK